MNKIQDGTPLISLVEQCKDSYKLPQTQLVYKAFFGRPKTMFEVSKETDISRANICRYIAKWKRENKIAVVFFGICPISKHNKVQFLTTDPNLYPRRRQLNLFEHTNTK